MLREFMGWAYDGLSGKIQILSTEEFFFYNPPKESPLTREDIQR